MGELSNSINRYVAIGSVAFTFSTIFYLLFSLFELFPPLTNHMTWTLLVITAAIILLMALKNWLPIVHPAVHRIVEVLIVMSVLLLAGSVFHVFPFTLRTAGAVCLVGLFTYLIVMVVAYIGNMLSAHEINAAIQERKRGK